MVSSMTSRFHRMRPCRLLPVLAVLVSLFLPSTSSAFIRRDLSPDLSFLAAETCRNVPVAYKDPTGEATYESIAGYNVVNGVPQVKVQTYEWFWYYMRGIHDAKPIGSAVWRPAQDRELQYFTHDAEGWSIKDANTRWAIGWQHAAQDLEPARKQIEKIEATALLAPVVAPVAVEAASTAQIWAYLRIAQPVAQWMNKGGWIRAGIATLLGYEITPQGRQVTCELASRTYALGELMPNGQIAGVGPGAMYSGELVPGRAASFAELNALRTVGDNLTPHHMPQAALEFTTYAEGGSVMLPQTEHVLTRTYGMRGAILAEEEAGLPFRTVLARDIVDLRRIAGAKYNAGVRALIDYYRQHFPELISKPSP